jgi:thioredoxin 1
MDRIAFIEELKHNPGVIVVKYSATWCNPCKQIAPYVASKKAELPPNVKFLELDLDKDMDLYALLKAKQQVRGVPVLLAYKRGNVTPYADKSITGTVTASIDAFFRVLPALAAEQEK